MKILIDCRLYGLEHAGIGRYIISLIRELKALSAGGLDAKEDLHFIVLLRKKYFDTLELPDNWRKVLADFGIYGIQEQMRLPLIINKEHPDVVHFPHFNVPVFYGGNYVVTIHDMTMHKQGVNATKLSLPIYFLKQFFYKFIFRYAVNKSKLIITPSQAVSKELSNYYSIEEGKIRVIYEGVDSAFSFPVSNRSEVEILSSLKLNKDGYFFYVGNYYPHKNIRFAIDALQLLNRNLNTQYKFCIAGSKDVFLQKTINYARQTHEDGNVDFLGKLTDEQLRVVYKNSIAFIYPSLAEGFGLQGLEAIASGTVVLASDIPVFKEIYGDNVYYFNPYKVDSLVECMKNVVKLNFIDKSNIVEMSRKILPKYNWKEMAIKTLELYKKLI